MDRTGAFEDLQLGSLGLTIDGLAGVDSLTANGLPGDDLITLNVLAGDNPGRTPSDTCHSAC